jgi:hypothetical protein
MTVHCNYFGQHKKRGVNVHNISTLKIPMRPTIEHKRGCELKSRRESFSGVGKVSLTFPLAHFSFCMFAFLLIPNSKNFGETRVFQLEFFSSLSSLLSMNIALGFF